MGNLLSSQEPLCSSISWVKFIFSFSVKLQAFSSTFLAHYFLILFVLKACVAVEISLKKYEFFLSIDHMMLCDRLLKQL